MIETGRDSLAGKAAVVTGAASGIGLAIARSLAYAGVRVCLADIQMPALEREVSALNETGAEAIFVIADLKSEDLRRQLPAQSKIGPVEKIRDLVNLQLPGIPVAPMPVAPRQIPYNSGYLYFEFDKNSPMWRSLKTSGGIAFHFGGEFAGLDLQLWAIRG